ncbi:MAG TPA: Ig-like domain-containing protein, partial [Treponemataceae bacterium]|nr:Ig-like domain-containing protein [Treponemataceae bacterium]
MKNAQKKGLMALAALAVLPVIFLSNCKVGLGSAVDTKAPTVAITYPSTDSVIRGKFVMSGTAEDETGIASVKVVLTKLPAALGIKSEEIKGSMDTQNGKTWTASI